jgi:hypothetical protein
VTNLVNPYWFGSGGGGGDPTIVWDTTPLEAYWNADGSNDGGAELLLYFYESVQLTPAAATGITGRIDGNNFYVATIDPGGFGTGEYLLKYEQVTLISGAWSSMVLNFVDQPGVWVELFRADLRLRDLTDDATVQNVIIDVSIATDDGAGAPVAGTTVTKRVTLYADYGNSRNVRDLFSGVNGTAITAHTPNTDTVGGGWAIDAGSHELQSGHCAGGAAGDHRSVIDTPSGECVCRAQIRSDPGGGSSLPYGLIGRRQDASNYWELIVVDAETANPTLELNEISSGTPTTQDSVVMTGLGPLDNLDCWIQMECDGNDIVGYFDGPFRTTVPTKFSISDSSGTLSTETHFGMRSTGTGTLIDDFATKIP